LEKQADRAVLDPKVYRDLPEMMERKVFLVAMVHRDFRD
jgi:hypothetical protein